ncbi:hypothetical protein FA95DRAFT_1558888 [Auriscalpium vulgare]|uniref:Uncharacterized protein n=1 Tax=Auriscalpium vulgare TaxID=40419 RepID=A0ACB8RU71_9AGAM|nr:hypothetical protein FA95DRAFT_1558888 [Auriscalpium vulgare]
MPSPQASSALFSVPSEVAEQALALCHPRDVASFAQTCHRARALVYEPSDHFLWRSLYLNYPFDDPRIGRRKSHDAFTFDWRRTLQRRVHVEGISLGGGDRHELLDTLLECIASAAPFTPGHEHEHSYNLAWVEHLLLESDTLSVETAFSEMEKLARLRAYLALSLEPGIGLLAPDRLKVMRRMSRVFVYDLRNYTAEAQWGPFTDDGRIVNWMHVHAIVTVITMNLRDFGSNWPQDFKPASVTQGLEATRAYSAPGTLKRSHRDWAGVEGYWMRIVCFCDYRDLIRFNASGWRPTFFDDSYEEASRLLRLNLHIISVEDDPAVLTTLPDPNRPPIKFGGTMRGFNAEEVLARAVRGTVRIMEDGNIRWSFTSIYDSNDQWSSEGVQIGNVCSAAGVVGAWTGAYHDHGDPSGPFWLFKASETTPKLRWAD